MSRRAAAHRHDGGLPAFGDTEKETSWDFCPGRFSACPSRRAASRFSYLVSSGSFKPSYRFGVFHDPAMAGRWLVCLGVTGYYLLVSLLPVTRLLLLPPAKLAAKYDI